MSQAVALPGSSKPIKSEMSSIVQIIEKKAKNEKLSAEEIEVFVKAVANETIGDAQIGAFLMAVYLNDMSDDECAALTTQMSQYGDRLDFSDQDYAKRVVDKHSTGGVGDKISLLLAPAIASLGCKIPMISGRGLGFTGGTLDKLESIPGYKVEMDLNKMKKTIKDVGVFISGQTSNVAPVDKKLYSIRDISGTVSSDPLIVSSIMSKKIIEGLRVLLLDVKVGKAALMKSEKDAARLAKKMIQVGQKCGITMVAFLTKMDHPIGHGIGNALEVVDALQGLNGKMGEDQRELVVKEGGMLLYMTGLANSFEDGQKKMKTVLSDGTALNKFKEMIKVQGVSADLADKLCAKGDHPLKYYLTLMKCNDARRTEVKATKKGIITNMDALEIAEFARKMGAGRTVPTDQLDFAVGFYLYKKVGDAVREGDVWTEVFHHDPLSSDDMRKIQSFLTIDEKDSSSSSHRQSVVLKVIAKP